MGVHGGLCFLQIQALVVTSSDLSDCYRYPRSGIPLGCWRVYSLAFLTYSLASLHFMPRLLLNFQFFRKTSGWLLGSLVLHSSFESALRYLSFLWEDQTLPVMEHAAVPSMGPRLVSAQSFGVQLCRACGLLWPTECDVVALAVWRSGRFVSLGPATVPSG